MNKAKSWPYGTYILVGGKRKCVLGDDHYNGTEIKLSNNSKGKFRGEKCYFKKVVYRDPWVAQQFGACLWPRARSWRPGIESYIGLPVHGACFSLCLCLCLSLSLSLVNK